MSLVAGVAAGLAGLETELMLSGWRKHHPGTLLPVLAGITVPAAVAWSCLTFA